jgi:hypothetical protein
MKTLLCVLALGACCCLFSNAASAQQSIFWKVKPNCKDYIPPDHTCQLVDQAVTINGDTTPYHEWILTIKAPRIVTGVKCHLTGDHQFEYAGPDGNSPKRNPFPGTWDGFVGMCRGWINGGDAPVEMTVFFR